MLKFVAALVSMAIVLYLAISPVIDLLYPTSAQGATDWPLLKERLDETKGGFTETVSKVSHVLKSVNNSELLTTLDGALSLGNAHFSTLDKAVDQQELTAEEARTLLEEVKRNMLFVKTEVLSELGEKAPDDAKRVVETIEAANINCEEKQEEIGALLGA